MKPKQKPLVSNQPTESENISARHRRFLEVLLAGASVVAVGMCVGHKNEGEPNTGAESAKTAEQKKTPSAENDGPSDNLKINLEIPKSIDSKKEAIQTIISGYNTFLTAYTGNSVEDRDQGNEGFVILYNAVRNGLTDDKLKADLPDLTVQDFKDKSVLDKLSRIEELLNSESYYLHIMPKSFEDIGYVAMMSGEVVSRHNREAKRDGKSVKYEHVVIDFENPSDDVNRYYVFLSQIAALTHRWEAGEEQTIMQQKWAYRGKVDDAYAKMLADPGSPTAIILREFRDMPTKEAKAKLFDQFMSSSLSHEEQHVIDGVLSYKEEVDAPPGLKAASHHYTEMRGLLAGVASDAPKAGLVNITKQQEEFSGEQQVIARFAQLLLVAAAPVKPLEFLAWPDNKQRELAAQVLRVSEPFLGVNFDNDEQITQTTKKIEAELERIKKGFEKSPAASHGVDQ